MMKRVLSILMAVLMVLAMIPAVAHSEGYQTEAYVKVTNCTLRKQPVSDTSGDNKLAALENGYTMFIVGESGGYYCVQPSSVCNREGVSLGLSDFAEDNSQQWGFVKKGHVKVGKKQLVELVQYAVLYDDMVADDAHEIAEKSKGSVHILLEIRQDSYGRRWYKVQLNEKAAGVAYVLAENAVIQGEAVGQFYQQQPQQPQQPQQQQAAVVVAQPVVTQAPVVQTGEYAIEENGHSKLFNERCLNVGQFATPEGDKVAVRMNPTENSRFFGYLNAGEEVEILGEQGMFTIVKYEYNGKLYKGYIYTQLLIASNG